MMNSASRFPLLSGALLVAVPLLMPATAQAQLVLDGQVKVEVAHNEDTGINTKRIRGSFDGKIWNDVGLQLDLGTGKHENHESTAPSATLHLYYAPDESLSYGVFLAAEDRRPGNSYFWGGEFAYTSGGFGLQGYAAYRDDIADTTDGTRYGLDVSFTPATAERWTLLAGAVADDGAPLERSYGYIGATYTIRDGIDIGMTAGRTDDDATIASLLVTFNFGDGATFHARDSLELYPGY